VQSTGKAVQGSSSQVSAKSLLPLNGLEQRLEISFAEASASLALNDLEK
jgi:hypothetical protein